MASILSLRDNGVALSTRHLEYDVGFVFSAILTFSAGSVLSYLLVQRILVAKWWRLPFVAWVVLSIYGVSWGFVFASTIVNYGIGVNSSLGACSAAILICLFCYANSKCIYLFLVEKAFIIRGGTKRRLESKLYIFNSFGIMTLYMVVGGLSFFYRMVRMENGHCIIGIQNPGLVPLIVLSIVANVYITLLIINPFRGIPLFKGLSNGTANPPRLRAAATRTATGALCTMISGVINFSVLMALQGEPGWIFLTCCNADILFSTLVIYWVTARDNSSAIESAPTASPSASSNTPSDKRSSRRPHSASMTSPLSSALSSRRSQKKFTISLPLNTTSSSQYEHIFGEPEPETENRNRECRQCEHKKKQQRCCCGRKHGWPLRLDLDFHTKIQTRLIRFR
ncbi:uncharacterized protein GGS25DRAFT_528725 [Hypoxylon fragiforme]|uniref:uncharacterized protein n=1 Tax=Hypoxylon fragiforme TaxID=63214 RepID=UPI0020C5EC66|nr:uncharacterized protein GGS25DRAFT_528725 [Hypoxylon fragiforme]KAI2602770.1 hypothetical protein GGS25DRAFT_528725 [Hypoxylon fragiforme]